MICHVHLSCFCQLLFFMPAVTVFTSMDLCAAVGVHQSDLTTVRLCEVQTFAKKKRLLVLPSWWFCVYLCDLQRRSLGHFGRAAWGRQPVFGHAPHPRTHCHTWSHSAWWSGHGHQCKTPNSPSVVEERRRGIKGGERENKILKVTGTRSITPSPQDVHWELEKQLHFHCCFEKNKNASTGTEYCTLLHSIGRTHGRAHTLCSTLNTCSLM